MIPHPYRVWSFFVVDNVAQVLSQHIPNKAQLDLQLALGLTVTHQHGIRSVFTNAEECKLRHRKNGRTYGGKIKVVVILFPSCFTNSIVWLQVAKMIKANEIDNQGRRRVFETVGFTFLNRLLATSEHAEYILHAPHTR